MRKTTRKTKGTILICIAVLLMLTLAVGCSRSKTGSSISAESTNGTGSVSFSIQWPESAYMKSGVPAQASVEAISGVDCDKLGVVTIEAVITDVSGNSLGTGAWQCSAHSGTINNIPEGSDRKIIITAKDSVGSVLYQGERAGIAVTGGQDNHIGTVEMSLALNAIIDSPSSNQTILTGKTVKFLGSASGGTGIYTYQWAIDGGSPNTSTQQNPGDVMFNISGSFTVTLTVTDSANHISKTAVVINVNKAQELKATISPSINTTITAGSSVTFSGSISGDGREPYKYNWDFGGGATIVDPAVKDPGDVKFSTPSTGAGYTVTFKATDADGKTSSASVIIIVNAPPVIYSPPKVAITSPANGIEAISGDIILFQGAITPGSVPNPTVEWTISSTSQTAIPPFSNPDQLSQSYVFNILATYTITMTVKDGQSSPHASVTVDVKKAWSGATLVEKSTTTNDTHPYIAADYIGNAIGIWLQEGDNSIWYSCYTPDGWNDEQQLFAASTNYTAAPQITCNWNSSYVNAFAWWYQSKNGFWVTRYYTGWGVAGRWTDPTLVTTDPSIQYRTADVGCDSRANAIAVWSQFSISTNGSIQARHYTDSGGWGPVQLVGATGGRLASNPHVTCDDSGNAIAIWEDIGVFAKRYTSSDRWNGAIQTIGSNGREPWISGNSSGRAIIVWKQSDGKRFRTMAISYIPGTGWGTAQTIDNDDATSHAEYPQVSIDDSGNAVAVWLQSEDGLRHDVWANTYTPGSGWEKAQLLETDSSNNADYPSISCSNSGAVAAWQQSDGQRDNICAIHYTRNGGWGTPHVIDSYSGPTGFPKVTCDKSGNAIVVWHQCDGTYCHIAANVLQ